jgi:hypothetical protein
MAEGTTFTLVESRNSEGISSISANHHPCMPPRLMLALADARLRGLHVNPSRSATIGRWPGSPLVLSWVAIGCHNDLQDEGSQRECGGAKGMRHLGESVDEWTGRQGVACLFAAYWTREDESIQKKRHVDD